MHASGTTRLHPLAGDAVAGGGQCCGSRRAHGRSRGRLRLCPDVAGDGDALEWYVNFADPHLFVAYGSALFAQDEMQVAEHPALGALKEALDAQGHDAVTVENGRLTPVLVMGAERRCRVTTDRSPAAPTACMAMRSRAQTRIRCDAPPPGSSHQRSRTSSRWLPHPVATDATACPKSRPCSPPRSQVFARYWSPCDSAMSPARLGSTPASGAAEPSAVTVCSWRRSSSWRLRWQGWSVWCSTPSMRQAPRHPSPPESSLRGL